MEVPMQSARRNAQPREIALEDLLGRKPESWDVELICERIAGQVVMVTGAAGSIGSELCREILKLAPRLLVAVDLAETPLFLLGTQLRDMDGGTHCVLELGSVTSAADVNRWMTKYRPSIVYHAAAYKHVSMMERNVFVAIENNVSGTWNLARAAAEHGAEHFIFLSTDKAVRPSSVMGATKRVAELLVQSLNKESGTKFATVRFGNVLGSSGSVAPIFQRQIAAGGPVTLSHSEMQRYFMTGSEAAHVLLLALSMSQGGETFLFDSGDAVGIADLAEKMIGLSGLEPGHDIEIRFTGMGPGEKLVEELHEESETPVATAHSRIRTVQAHLEWTRDRSDEWMSRLELASRARDEALAIGLLKEAVPDYEPSLLHAPGALSKP
jgi:FlaA1/EpsC-like NDP-sugar epimerase